MTLTSLTLPHLALYSAADIHELFRLLGYDMVPLVPIEGKDLASFEFDNVDAQSVERAYLIAERDNHMVYLFEVNDLRQTRLRGLAWNALQRGTALLVITRDYREVLFVDPRFAGSPNKSNVRVNKLKVITNDPTRHDLDTLNAIHAHRRTGQQIYDAQAEAFNVTRITKRFYDEYRQNYEHTRQVIRQYNKGFPEFQNEDQADKLHAFTQRLLGRLMFLYFLQRKGWLGGDQKFLSNMFRKTLQAYSDEIHDDQESFFYYREVLEPLFFDTMNTKRPDNITRWPGVRIPYLNGGLFDEARDPQGMILLPDSLFDPYSADGLLAFFNRYNFTIAEDTPLEQDVAVDPEMLGKVFENLLEERDRGQSGSFYTPRTIVSYMCQEALAGYLEESADIPRDQTRAQFDPDRDEPFTPEEAERLAKALDTLTVLDPAVGSGSFLIGMLNEIMRLREACAAAQSIDITPTLRADWKESVIRDTLYGVDIKPEAIEIAQLRLWLALVIDQSIEDAQPLPNLDYKLMAGNSLIETIDGEPVLGTQMLHGEMNGQAALVQTDFVDDAVQSRMALFDDEKRLASERVKLSELRQRYFRASPEDRKQLKTSITAQERRIVQASLTEKASKAQAQIDNLGKKSGLKPLTRAEQNRLTEAIHRLEHINTLQQDVSKPEKSLPFFLYHLHFSEVFAAKGGFDIVVANPPYVPITKIPNSDRATYINLFRSAVGRFNLFYFFLERSAQLARSNGISAYIVPDRLLLNTQSHQLRLWLLRDQDIQEIVSFDSEVFDTAIVDNVIIIYCNRHNTSHEIRAKYRVNPQKLFTHERISIPISFFETSVNHQFNINYNIGLDTLIKRIRKNATLLGEIADIKDGIIQGKVADMLFLKEPLDSDSKKLLFGENVHRFRIAFDNNWVNYKPNALMKLEVERRGEGVRHGLWMRTPDIFERIKILTRQTADRIIAALDTENYYYANTLHGTHVLNQQYNPLFVLGILNSTLLTWYYRQTTEENDKVFAQIKINILGQLPIPTQLSEQTKIVHTVKQCIDTAKSAPERLPLLEAQLNGLVYEAYGLNETDIQVIEGTMAKSFDDHS